MVCPNCGEHVGRFELNLNCKKCGVNLYYSQQEQLLSDDAKSCELEFASFRILSAKIKTAFVGGSAQIARIVFTVLCIGVVLIPFGNISASMPLYSGSVSFGGYGLYQAFSNGSLLGLLDYLKISVTHELALKSLLLVGAMVLILLMSLVMLLTELLSFTNIQRSAKALCIQSAIGVVICAASVVFSFMLSGVGEGFTAISVESSSGFGGFVSAAMFAAMFIVNLVIIKRGIKPEYKEVDLQRIEMRKKVKSGAVQLADLPLPVFESEEERQTRLKLEAQDRAYEEKQSKAAGGGANG